VKLPAGPPPVAETSAVFAVVKPEGAALVDAMSNLSLVARMAILANRRDPASAIIRMGYSD
jgi:hypothetical protein